MPCFDTSCRGKRAAVAKAWALKTALCYGYSLLPSSPAQRPCLPGCCPELRPGPAYDSDRDPWSGGPGPQPSRWSYTCQRDVSLGAGQHSARWPPSQPLPILFNCRHQCAPPAPPPLHSTWLPCPLPHSLATPTPPIPPLHLVWRSPLPRLPSFPHLVLPAPTPAPNPRHPLPALSSVARQRPIPIGPHTRSYAPLCLPASSPLLNHCPRPAIHHSLL